MMSPVYNTNNNLNWLVRQYILIMIAAARVPFEVDMYSSCS